MERGRGCQPLSPLIQRSKDPKGRKTAKWISHIKHQDLTFDRHAVCSAAVVLGVVWAQLTSHRQHKICVRRGRARQLWAPPADQNCDGLESRPHGRYRSFASAAAPATASAARATARAAAAGLPLGPPRDLPTPVLRVLDAHKSCRSGQRHSEHRSAHNARSKLKRNNKRTARAV